MDSEKPGTTNLMNNCMKKILLLVCCAFIGMSATAQNEAYWGVRAGYTNSKIKAAASGESMSYGSKSGFQLGVSYNLPLMRKTPLYLETGLYYTSRGTNNFVMFDSNVEYGAMGNIRTSYLQLPVLLSYHFKIGKSFSIQPYAGVYYALGISGKMKNAYSIEVRNGGEDIQPVDDVKVFKKDEDNNQLFKRSDFGLRFGVGFTMKQMYLGAGYDLGLTNIFKGSEELGYGKNGMKLKNGAFYINVGYNF